MPILRQKRQWGSDAPEAQLCAETRLQAEFRATHHFRTTNDNCRRWFRESHPFRLCLVCASPKITTTSDKLLFPDQGGS